MKEYLKMADCFNAGMPDVKTRLFYAEHAINAHDELVAEVERLNLKVEDLLRCVDLAVMSGDLSPIYGARKKYITD